MYRSQACRAGGTCGVVGGLGAGQGRARRAGRRPHPSSEIFTALLFAQKPHYLKRIEALRAVKMQI